ncbi:hypothetical protein [Prosthecobacter sp.]|jgi:hypothetical protein|uniref:hypothetical protein n=1 Tax=Prosthecobacter sp. TaxID=1965333 RepID=UPI003782FA60
MQIRFLSDGNEFRSYGGGSFSKKKDSGGIFWWTILITLLMGFATFCWFFSIMVFAHPEKPFNYRVLARFDKLDPLRKFTNYTVPQGKFLPARDLLAEFYAFSREQLAVKNDLLKRSYIRNYKQEQPLYVKGTFQVVNARPLTAGDVITEGWVVRARSTDIEDVDIEIVLPGNKGESDPYHAGDTLVLDQKNTFAAALHVQKFDQERVCVTLMPLAYQGFAAKDGKQFEMKPPLKLNMDAYWPLTRDPGAAVLEDSTGKVVSKEG